MKNPFQDFSDAAARPVEFFIVLLVSGCVSALLIRWLLNL